SNKPQPRKMTGSGCLSREQISTASVTSWHLSPTPSLCRARRSLALVRSSCYPANGRASSQHLNRHKAMYLRPVLILILLVEVATAWPATAAAATVPDPKRLLRMSVVSQAARARSQAPQTLEVALDSKLDTVLTGELQLQIFVGRRLVQEWRSGELVVPF